MVLCWNQISFYEESNPHNSFPVESLILSDSPQEDEKRPQDGPAPFACPGEESCRIAPQSSPCPSSGPGGPQLPSAPQS